MIRNCEMDFLKELIVRYRKYWKGIPPWYAPFEGLFNVNSSKAEKLYLRTVELLKKRGNVISIRDTDPRKPFRSLPFPYKLEAEIEIDGEKYFFSLWYGGLDPKKRFWIEIRKL